MDTHVEIQHLVKKAQTGNTEAFGDIYDFYLDTIYRFVSFRVNTREDAEDITEQIFVTMFTAIKHYKERGLPFEAWMYRIARNKIIDFYRSQKHNTNIDAIAETPDSQPLPEDILQLKSTKEAILNALQKIPQQYKEIIMLKFIEEKENEEISIILEKPIAHIRVLQHRALHSLKQVVTI